jgi:rare lipoprotein A
MRFLASLLLVTLLVACSSGSRYSQSEDGAPRVRLDPAKIVDAVPRQDPVTRAGNKNPYTINGKTYHLLPASDGYKARGFASWYGTKFHGHATANGETYSLYEMTAAHKTLPIPCYVKVTNLRTGRTAIVRVNDRGPFHDDRIIDLSYAAAVKLGYADKGTAYVEVEVVDPTAPVPFKPVVAVEAEAVRPVVDVDVVEEMAETVVGSKPQHFLQAGAFRSIDSALRLQSQIEIITRQPVRIDESEAAGLFRVRVGPLASIADVQRVSQQLRELQLSPRLITQ